MPGGGAISRKTKPGAEARISRGTIIRRQAVSDREARDAFRTIVKWIGEDATATGWPKRQPGSSRLPRIFRRLNPEQILRKTFGEVDGYDEMIVVRGVTFESHCEHHITPIIGRVWVGYIPDRRVVGISKLARVVEILSKRLQI